MAPYGLYNGLSYLKKAHPRTLGAGGGRGAGAWKRGFVSTSGFANTDAAGPDRCWTWSAQRSTLAKCSV